MCPTPSSKLQDRNGQVLTEAIVALSVLTIGYLAILSLLNRSVGTSRVVSDQNTATYLAAEGLEVVRNLVDANPLRLCGPNPCPFNDGFDAAPGSYEVSYETELEPDADPDNKNPGRRLNLAQVCPQGPCPILYDPALGYNYTTGRPTSFFRVITIDSSPGVPASAALRATSRVYWATRGGGNSEIRLQVYLFAKQ